MSDPKCMPTPSSQQAAQSRGRLYAFLSAAWRYPDESLVEGLREPGALETDSVFLDSPAVGEALGSLREIRDRFDRRRNSAVLRELVSAHTRLFGHSVRGTCPPYELEYGRGEIIQQTADLADLAGFYSAFGLGLLDSALERADHVSVECEFMGVLCAKEAWGRRQENYELVEMCRDAQRLFLRDHLARWLPAFAHRVAALDQDGFHGHAAALAAAFIAEECQMFNIESGPQWLELRPVDPSRDAEIDCESAGCGEPAGERIVQLGMESLTGNAK